MKRSDLNQLKETDTQSLQDRVSELSNELTKARLERTMNTVKNTNITKNTRKEIARIKTILHEKKLLEEASR